MFSVANRPLQIEFKSFFDPLFDDFKSFSEFCHKGENESVRKFF